MELKKLSESAANIMETSVEVAVATTSEDWDVIRDLFVSSFINYPLYQYFVTDKNQRPQFLRAYMDANYEVLCQNGIALLIAVKTLVEGEKKIVGGSLFAKQCCNETGWANLSEEVLFDAYEKHGLREISVEGMDRLISYETWENTKIADPLSKLNRQMWNGFFCAIDPQYSCRKVGTSAYQLTKDLLVAKSIKTGDTIHEITEEMWKSKYDASTDFKNCFIAISHDMRAVKFHLANGMKMISQIKYEDKNSSMDVSVMISKLPDGPNK